MGTVGRLWPVIPALAALVLAGCSRKPTAEPISLSKFGGEVTLRLNVQKRDVFTYRTTEVQPDGSTVATDEKSEVINAQGGEIQILRTILNVDCRGRMPERARRREQARIGSEYQHLCDRFAADRSVIKLPSSGSSLNEAPSAPIRTAGLQGITFPEQALKIGSQWNVDVDRSHGSSGMEYDPPIVRYTFTLKGAEDDGARTMLVVEEAMNARVRLGRSSSPLGESPSSSGVPDAWDYGFNGTMHIDTATGLIVREENERVYTSLPGARKMTLKWHVDYVLREFIRGGVATKVD